jgi:hypothetical protein
MSILFSCSACVQFVWQVRITEDAGKNLFGIANQYQELAAQMLYPYYTDPFTKL